LEAPGAATYIIPGWQMADTQQEAALAYDREARQCGEDKPTNYENIKAAEGAAKRAQTGHILVHVMCAGPALWFFGWRVEGRGASAL
jgi:hypothetical protein